MTKPFPQLTALVCAVTLLLSCLPASADWFDDKVNSASEMASMVPDSSLAVVSWSLGTVMNEAKKRQVWDKISEALPNELSEGLPEFESRLGESVQNIVDFQSGNGYLTVGAVDDLSKPPHVVLGLELKHPKSFDDWFTGFLQREAQMKATSQGKFKTWDFTSQGGPKVYLGEGWLFAGNSPESFEAHLKALDGQGRLGQSARFQKALNSIDSSQSAMFLYVDSTTFYRVLEDGLAQDGMEIPDALNVWDYGVFSLNFVGQESHGLLAFRDNDGPLAHALRRPGSVGPELFAQLPQSLSSMGAVDLNWGAHVVEGFLDSVPEIAPMAYMFLNEAKSYGDPTKAFTGRAVYATDGLETLGPSFLSFDSHIDEQMQLTACKSNLKNVATALEMYSTDWSGHYTDDLDKLVPNYLREIPECPAAEKVTYKETFQTGPDAPLNEANFQDYFYLECNGNHHSENAENHPQYTSVIGLVWEEESAEEPVKNDEKLTPSTIVVAEVSDVSEAHKLLSALNAVPKVDELTGCQSNLKNIGTALEMYSTDWAGHYPEDTTKLVPDYLRTMPKCPTADKDTYSQMYQTGPDAPGNEPKFQDYYHVECHGHHHKQLLANHPYYNGLIGLETGPVSNIVEPVEETSDPVPTEPRFYGDGDFKFYLDPQRKVTIFAIGSKAEEWIRAKPSARLPEELVSALDWGQNQVIYSTYSDLNGLYEFGLSYLKEQGNDAGAEALKAVKDWSGDLKDAQVFRATPEGLRFRGKGYGSSAGITAPALVGAAILVPNFVRARAQGQLTACKSNLKNIGTGCEMWATDYNGEYPKTLDQLAPDYLLRLPICPAAGEQTYVQSYSSQPAKPGEPWSGTYKVYCSGEHHSELGVPANFPQYNSVSGLMER